VGSWDGQQWRHLPDSRFCVINSGAEGWGEDGEKASHPGSCCPLLAAATATFSLQMLAPGSLSCGHPRPESPAAQRARIWHLGVGISLSVGIRGTSRQGLPTS